MARERLIEAVWERTSRFLREGAGRIAPLALAAIFLPQWLSGATAPWRAEGAAAGALAAGSGLLALAATVVSLWAQLALTGRAVADARGEVGHGAGHPASLLAGRRLLPVIGLSLLLLLVVALLAVPVLAILAAYGVDLTGAGGSTTPGPAAVAWIGLYLLLVTPLFLWIASRLLPLTAVVLFERRGLGAFARTWRLTRGHGGGLFGALLLYAVVAAVTVIAVQSGVGVVLQLLLRGGDAPVTAASVLTAGVTALATTGLAVVQAVFVGKLYAALAPAGDAAEARGR